MKRRVISGILVLVVASLTWAVFTHHQLIKDHYVVRTTSLQPESSTISDKLELTDQGSFLYKASQPVIQASDAFNESCKSVAHEHSIVLGCYTKQKIFVYNVTDQRLNGVQEVTAAHELLHAVYERLSQSEKDELNTLLTSTANSIDDQRFKETVDEYRRTEPGQVENELHSILGTEIAVLPAKLEAHYNKYFNNRAKIVTYAKQYEEAFTSLDAKIKNYDQQLADLKSEKESLESTLNAKQRAIEEDKARLDTLRSSGDTEAYNAGVPGFNDQIQEYNRDISNLKQIINQYNALVETRNSLAATQNDLVKQLDSSYSPL
jgi:DNA repair exonuclease SbcCD ATPase subunit